MAVTGGARPAGPREERRLGGSWLWLFPATMVAHVAEETTAFGTFPVWISRVAGADLTLREFLVANALALAFVVAGVVVARGPWGGWAVAALGTAVVTNAVFHLAGTLLTGTVSPGVVTATLVWVPLGAFALVRSARRGRRRDLALGIAVGFAAHGLVSLTLAVA